VDIGNPPCCDSKFNAGITFQQDFRTRDKVRLALVEHEQWKREVRKT